MTIKTIQAAALVKRQSHLKSKLPGQNQKTAEKNQAPTNVPNKTERSVSRMDSDGGSHGSVGP
jgi:hypothetical protein